MKNSRGKLVVIEGTDGSGKKTQTALLVDRLKKDGSRAVSQSFPQYGAKSAGPTEEFLSGKYGDPTIVNPYIASIFYAVDRFDFSQKIKERLARGSVVVLDRYVDSNVGHQGGKIKNAKKRVNYVRWLYDLEYRIFGIPRPDLVLILHVPADWNQKLIPRKQTAVTLEKTHKLGREHLKNTEAAYRWLAKKFPKNHRVVECVERGAILPPNVIHEKIWGILKKYAAIP